MMRYGIALGFITFQLIVFLLGVAAGKSSIVPPTAPVHQIVPVACPANGYKVYPIQRGDTLWDLSRTFSVSLDQLLKLNGLTLDTAVKLHPGYSLCVPSSG
jgi:LysM repeat protein